MFVQSDPYLTAFLSVGTFDSTECVISWANTCISSHQTFAKIMDFYKNLTVSDWASLIPFGIACAAVGFGVKTVVDKQIGGPCNPKIRKGESKVVDTVDIEELGNKAVFCRCWRSSKFPYCDGTHNQHNVACGDNVGPLIVKKKD